ncbi:uncharacterized protein LOC125939995 [Dermacentor silvarum]|uniref:uncharacterized protein LOC125939995 n=1 Tax=Dermacentor silvarum TaxID=543639 RepID=UPI002100EE47|nr:uncharacterized protein LOC125939995 [Dermacentor silvarum]
MVESRTLLWSLVVSACCLAASAGPPGVTTTDSSLLPSSMVADSTLTREERGNVFVHPYYRTSPEPNSTDEQQTSHGAGSGVADPRPLPPRSPPPRRHRTRFGLRRPSLAKGLYPPFQVYSVNAGHSAPQEEPSGLDPKTANQDKDQYSKSEKGIHGSRIPESKDIVSPPQPEPRVNGTLVEAANGTAAEDTSGVTTMVLSETTIWTLALCATMIIAAVAFFAVVLAVCRCRQQRERRKRYLNTHKNIRVMQNMVKIAKRREKQATVNQGPFSRISIS